MRLQQGVIENLFFFSIAVPFQQNQFFLLKKLLSSTQPFSISNQTTGSLSHSKSTPSAYGSSSNFSSTSRSISADQTQHNRSFPVSESPFLVETAWDRAPRDAKQELQIAYYDRCPSLNQYHDSCAWFQVCCCRSQTSRGKPWADAWRVKKWHADSFGCHRPGSQMLTIRPIFPGHTFKPVVEEILQCSHWEREVSQQVAAMLPSHALVRERMRRWHPPVTQTVTQTVQIPSAPRGDLRHCLQASMATNTRCRLQGRGNPGRCAPAHQRSSRQFQQNRLRQPPRQDPPQFQQPQQGP
ncbi:UNVERIFIED_CONTAM: hypothetical protein FKN15_062749 [Acipenser sinensis]